MNKKSYLKVNGDSSFLNKNKNKINLLVPWSNAEIYETAVKHLNDLVLERYNQFLEVGLKSIKAKLTEKEFLIIVASYPCPGYWNLNESFFEQILFDSMGKPSRHDKIKLKIIKKIKRFNFMEKITLVSCIEEFFQTASDSDIFYIIKLSAKNHDEYKKLKKQYIRDML